jgi:RNA polymerase sigma factor (TIGR02999 family)
VPFGTCAGRVSELNFPRSTPLPTSDVTLLLERWNRGDAQAYEALLALLYDELRALAGRLLRGERAGHTLQPTALVHEAYMRLIGLNALTLESRRHFYGAAAGTMRRVLVDHARQRNAHKRGGPDSVRIHVDDMDVLAGPEALDFEALDQALTALAVAAPEQARVVELRYFAGLSIDETAEMLAVSPATVKRHWAFSRAWLYRALTPGDGPGLPS